jgi:hypothetical protein
VTARAALGLDAHPADRAARVISLLVGSHEPAAARVHAACALGALIQPDRPWVARHGQREESFLRDRCLPRARLNRSAWPFPTAIAVATLVAARNSNQIRMNI